MADREEIYIKIYSDRGLKQWREKKKNLKFIKVAIRESCKLIIPFQPNISMYILHTFLYTFPKGLTRRICVRIKSCFS